MDIDEIFEKHNDEYLEFDRVEQKRSTRPDLHAFLLLDELFPRDRDMVCAAEHDEIFLDVNPEDAEKLTEGQIIELIRCGVRWDSEIDSLAMFA